MKTVKHLITFSLLAFCSISFSQEFNKRHIKKLENLGIEFKTEYSTSEKAIKDLHLVLRNDSKHRAKSTAGTILFSVGVAGLVGGALLTKNVRYDRHGYQRIASGGAFIVGAAGIGTSIPLFVGANRNIKKRDQLKMKYLEDSVKNTPIIEKEMVNN